MDKRDDLETDASMATNRVTELQEQLEGAQRKLRELTERLTLSDEERSVLQGRADGCIRINELRPILRRVFGEAA